MRRGILICFTTRSNKFKSAYERNKFFRNLYGWKQIIIAQNRKYIYRRDGLLDMVPHMRVDQSSFIVPEDEFDKIFDFFKRWSKKIIWKTFKILLEEKEWKEFFE